MSLVEIPAQALGKQARPVCSGLERLLGPSQALHKECGSQGSPVHAARGAVQTPEPVQCLLKRILQSAHSIALSSQLKPASETYACNWKVLERLRRDQTCLHM